MVCLELVVSVFGVVVKFGLVGWLYQKFCSIFLSNATGRAVRFDLT